MLSKRTQIIILAIIWSIVAVQAYRVLDDLNTTYKLEKRV